MFRCRTLRLSLIYAGWVIKNYYRILQVSDDAEPDVVRRAFETLTAPGRPAADRREFYEAFEALSDPEKRRNYDRAVARVRWSQRLLPSVAVAGILTMLFVGSRYSGSQSIDAIPVPTPLTKVHVQLAQVTATPVVSVTPFASVTPLVNAPAPGTVFYNEDFSGVERGYLPKNWVGGPKLVVDVASGKKFVRPFERPPQGHSVVVNDVPFPPNFEFELVVTMNNSGGVVCTAGSVKGGFLTSYEAILNDSKLSVTQDKSEKTGKISLRRVGPLVQLFMDGKEILMGRYAQDGAPPNSFSLELGPSTILHSLKGTAL